MNLVGVLEGILFVVGEEGVTIKQICDILNVDVDKAKELLLDLKRRYEDPAYGIRISYLGNSFKLSTKKEHREYFQKLIENPDSNVLSQAALETLAIVAYNQPITRVEIDEMRGVTNTHLIRKLLAKDLIKKIETIHPGVNINDIVSTENSTVNLSTKNNKISASVNIAKNVPKCNAISKDSGMCSSTISSLAGRCLP